MIKKTFCAALVVFGVILEIYFYTFRFSAEGLPLVIAILSGSALELFLAFLVYNSRQSRISAVLAVLVASYAVIQTSAGQTFALLSYTASIGVETENNTAAFTIEQCKQNIERLTTEADAITKQLKSLQSTEARAEYAGTIWRANNRLSEITRERTRLLDTLQKTTSTTVTDARMEDQKKSVYKFYASMVDWKKDDWMKFLFHFVFSVFISIMAPLGIIIWNRKAVRGTEFSKQQIEMFVAAAWYKIRNNVAPTVLSEIQYNELLQKRGHPVESGVYFALMNRCMQYGLVSTGGVAVEKDHRKVVARLTGERVNVWKMIKEKIKPSK